MHNFGPIFRGKREDLFFFLGILWGSLDDIGNGFFKVWMLVGSRICVFCVCEWMVELSGAVEMKILGRNVLARARGIREKSGGKGNG